MENSSRRELDSTSYRKVFEYIKENGIEQLLSFSNYLDLIQGMDFKAFLVERLFYKKDTFREIAQKNEDAIEFIKSLGIFGEKIIYNHHQELSFNSFIKDTSSKISNLDIFISNATLLEQLKVGRIVLSRNIADSALAHHRMEIYRNNEGNITDIFKVYSDADISYCGSEVESDGINRLYEEYVYGFGKVQPSIVLVSENHENKEQYRYAYIKDFGFNASMLPCEKELSSYEVPKSLRKNKEVFFR
jgi:hypothetical protein